ncbi:MAG: maleylpyruvate isomerase family mycothiol-dependent enzyme [Actinomycetota bacterium]|nr:maleylpyruvate isomerase family mycothiol-dependent enzyme [Actinomycetota bacterium]
MPQHPAPPTDLAGLVAAYEQTARAVVDLGQTLTARDFDKPTECPGWSVKDQFSHVVGLESWLDGATPPSVDVPDLPHVKNAQGEFIELFVQDRRDREGTDVVGELEDVIASRLSAMRDPSLNEDSAVKGPFGRTTASRAMTLRAIDIWVHEQDIRTAVGRPGDLDTAAASLFVAAIISAFPRVVARDAAVPVGHAVIVDVTGPVMARAGARVVLDAERRTWGEELFTGESHDEDTASAPMATTSIVLSTDALTRRGAGRRSVDDLVYSVTGDADIAAAVLENLVITS